MGLALPHRLRVALLSISILALSLSNFILGKEAQQDSSETDKKIMFAPPLQKAQGLGPISQKRRRRRQQKKQNAPRYDLNMIDPLAAATSSSPSIRRPSLALEPAVPYLGVLVDAGRHYYQIPWLERLIDYLHLMKFNLIHFRLTDDQAFNIRLDSHPELALASATSPNGSTVYTPLELRRLVKYAQERGIIIMPEINVPGHGGAWSGVPGLLVPCAAFICRQGKGIPLNVTHPKLMDILKNVIREVRDIFHTSPFLHMGGDELDNALPCFNEIRSDSFDYGRFEQNLERILRELKIPLERVIRWERNKAPGFRLQGSDALRAGGMVHYWQTREIEKDASSNKTAPFFLSQGLYFDILPKEDAFEIYSRTRSMLSMDPPPTGIVAGTFELNTETWLNRNVMGRLLAVAMGASREPQISQNKFDATYAKQCSLLGFHNSLCSLNGTAMEGYEKIWNRHWEAWRNALCKRLTISKTTRQLDTRYLRNEYNMMADSSMNFWKNFGVQKQKNEYDSILNNYTATKTLTSKSTLSAFPREIPYTGIILDLVTETPRSNKTERILQIIDTMASLGFNLLQLRVLSDMGFVLEVEGMQALSHSPLEDPEARVRTMPYRESQIRDIVLYAAKRGIQVMPEISLATRAGGWFRSRSLCPCVETICSKGRGLSVNVEEYSVIPHMASLILALRRLFSSPYLHLGYDEREEAMECFREAGIDDPDLNSFENKIHMILSIHNIPSEHILRWENIEAKVYPGRVGLGKHYRLTIPEAKARKDDGPVFVSTNLDFGQVVVDDDDDAWSIYQRVRTVLDASPTGVLAEVGVIDSESWRNLNVNGRLLAMSMGLSSSRRNPLMSRDEFQKTYLKACASLEGTSCGLFGRTSLDSSLQAERQERVKQLLEVSCRQRTMEYELISPGPLLLRTA